MASGLTSVLYRPSGLLASYVRSFQVLSTEGSARVSVLDFAGADVSVPLQFGDPVLIEGSTPWAVPSAAFVGPKGCSIPLRFWDRIDQVNVSFWPGAAGAFADVPMTEVFGQVAPPDQVWPREFLQQAAELEPLPTDERISRLSALLLSRLDLARDPGPQVREAVRLIYARHGRVRISWLADQVNLSVSQLERRFKRHVGVAPKFLARQTRVSSLAAEAGSLPRPDWTFLADKYGFSDQAHLTREFRELMGFTPAAFAGIGRDADFLQDALAYVNRD